VTGYVRVNITEALRERPSIEVSLGAAPIERGDAIEIAEQLRRAAGIVADLTPAPIYEDPF
jgi:hypothetical protein